MLTVCSTIQVSGQLTARNTDGKVATMYANAYGNRDTIFVFNQTPQPKSGNLYLKLSELSTFKWYKFDYETKDFEEEPFFIDEDVEETSFNDLQQGGYKVIATILDEEEPRDTTFIAWLYMNPGFEFNILKDNNGELMYNYKNCFYNDFRLSSNTVQSSFTYYNPYNLQIGALPPFVNRITYNIRRNNESEIVIPLNTQGLIQYLRDFDPPYEDTQYHFRAFDMFNVVRRDEIMYRSIIPFAVIDTLLPRKDSKSAPVPVKFTNKPYNVSEYVWRFGTGDSVVYNLGNIAPDTIEYTYYTPRRQGYQVTLKVTSLSGCQFTTEPTIITVDDPVLDVANVFTPNNDGINDYFKPHAVSLRGFEIWIYTRTGKRVYYYKGDNLRDWEGWDGRIEKSGREAPNGVYYYTIKALGWDEPATKNPPTGPYSGFVYLYR